MSEKKGMQSDLVASEQTIKTFDNESEQSIKTDRSLIIGQLGISSLLRLDLKLINTQGKAAVDTAAEVSIISDKLYNKQKTKPPTLRHAVVNTTGRGMTIDTFIVGPVNFQIGSKFYKTEFYVAPIVDDMLLRLNCMVTYNVTVDMGRSKFIIGGNEFHLNSDINSIIPVVARESIPQGTVIPPNTIVHVNG